MKIKVHFTSYILFLLCILSGFLTEILLIFISILFHEICHAFVSKLFGKDLLKITILPFGGIFEVKSDDNVKLLEEFFILISGPLGSLFLMQFDSLYELNKIILLFNLLPIYPLDGGKILEIFLCSFLSFKKVMRTNYLVSCIASLVLMLLSAYYLSINLMIISTVLFSINLGYITDIDIRYWNFLNDKRRNARLLPIKVHQNFDSNNYYRGYNNCFVVGGVFIGEMETLKKITNHTLDKSSGIPIEYIDGKHRNTVLNDEKRGILCR